MSADVADPRYRSTPAHLDSLLAEGDRLGFSQSCDLQTGTLLRTLAALKPGGRLLELGTGVGQSTAWILDGMDVESRLTSVDIAGEQLEVARRVLGGDSRVEFIHQDGADFLEGSDESFDFVFADAWPGKFTHRDQAIALLRLGGLYLIDDLNTQQNWPEGHQAKVDQLIAEIEGDRRLRCVKVSDSAGLVLGVRVV